MRLDIEELNALQPAERDRYRALESLFDHPGWKIVTTLAEESAKVQIQAAAFATSWDNNRLAIGRGAAWHEIAQLEEQTEAHYERIIGERQKADLVKIREEHDFE